jgi:protein O-GlcNAc transferase
MPPPNANVSGTLARAFAAHQAGNLAEAEFLYKLVLQSDKKQFDALHMLSVIEAQRGNFPAGIRRITEALRVRPNSADALINLGRMQGETGEVDRAIANYKKALALNPRSPLAHSNLSILLRRQRHTDEALAHCDAALAIAHDYADAHNNRGNVLFDLARHAEALQSYDRALAVAPNLVEAHLGRGNVLHQLARADEAVAAYERALAIHPAYAEAWFGLGIVWTKLGRRSDAFTAFDKAFAAKPDLPYLEGERLLSKLRICNWDNLDAERDRLAAAIERGAPASVPFNVVVISPSPADQRRCAELYVKDRYPPAPEPLWRGERYAHDRIRIAYVSADFHNHATAYLAAGQFEAHDRSRFETTALSIDLAPDDEMRARLRGAFDRYLDMSTRRENEIAGTLRELEIDIAVDLKGFTEFSRPAVFALRAAPIQVSFLGFPGTMAAPYIDYLVADATIIPGEHAPFYSENIVTLPNSYQANDAGRRIAERVPGRTELGLPETGFVFCSFNNSYKIAPPVFDIWIRLLQAVDGSVLWLLDENEASTRNLRQEARRCGIAPERLVFAPRAPLAEHLARQRQADIFLDTLPCTAHTTASDALWAGLPVLTCLGSTFAGRVAASLNRAVGLPELVAETLSDYEALALKIAREPAFCAALKTKLTHNRATYPLFDTQRFTRHIESAYTTMWRLYQNGEPPKSFAVDPM